MSEGENECFEKYVRMLGESERKLPDSPLGREYVGWVPGGLPLGDGRGKISDEMGPTSKRPRLI